MGSKNSRYQQLVDQVIDDENEITESFEIVWLNENSKDVLLEDQNYCEQIGALQDYKIRFFEDIYDCGYYLYNLPTSDRIIFLVDEKLADEIVFGIKTLCPIKFIFIIHSIEPSSTNESHHFPQNVKVKHVYPNQLADRIRLFQARFLRSNKEFFCSNIFQGNQTVEISSTKINGRFLFMQLLLDILLAMEPKITDKDELISQCTTFFAKNPAELKKVQEFHRTYRRDKALEWYSRDSFVYRLMNKSLRSENIDLMFLFRFFLQDMHHQLAVHQYPSLIRVYRGQRISKKEWSDLSKAIGQYISMTSFLSTTLEINVAKHLIEGDIGNGTDSDEIRILFDIEADPHMPGGIKPFADISVFSQLPEEKEVLFMVGSIFEIVDIIHSSTFPVIKMRLCSDDANNLKTTFEVLPHEYGGELLGNKYQASLNSFGIVLYNMNKFDMAAKFFRRIYYESRADDPERVRYCQNIGNAALHSGRYEECALWFNRGFELCETHQLRNSPVAANLHLTRGNLYATTGKRKRALESYEKALEIFRANFGENHPRIASCYSVMAKQYKRRKYYAIARDYYERAVSIATSTLGPRHPDVWQYHFLLSQLLIELRHRDLQGALHHAHAALDTANDVLLPDDVGVSHTYLILSHIYNLLGEFEESVHFFEKAKAWESSKWINTNAHGGNACRTDFICNRCRQWFWIYRSFDWMKHSWFNCILFHKIPSVYFDIKRHYYHY